MNIGFIGLGIMGKPMVRNLLKAGHKVWVHNRSKGPEEELARDGAIPASYQDLAAEARLIFTMLPNGPQVKEVLLGPDGLGRYLHEGQTVIDCSSISPVAAREIAGELEAKGVDMLDAPVSGSDVKAKDGTLAFMVGGKESVFEACKPILLQMGASAVRCGEVGAGNTTKLCNQIIVACNIQALAEALTLAKAAGVDPQLVFQAIRGGLAGSTVMEAKSPMMLSGDDTPGFKVDLHIKDLSNVADCAHAVGAPIPLTAQVTEVMQWLHTQGKGDADHSALIQYYEHLTGHKLSE